MLQTDFIASVPTLLKRQAKLRGDKVAYTDAGGAITYAALDQTTARLAGHLQAQGAAVGSAVAVFLPNSIAWIQTCFATLRAGAVSVPISYEATEPEVAYRIEDSDCRIVVTTDERAELVRRAAGARPLILILVDRGAKQDGVRLADLLTQEAEAPRDPERMHEASFIVYTSGTTGRAKGVLLSLHSMLWITAACWGPIYGITANDVILSPLPLFHSYALNLSVLSVLAIGASEHLMEKFSTKDALRLLGEGRFTFMPGVPTMFHYLVQAAEPGQKLPGLRLCVSAGAIMPATLNREFEDRFGVRLLDGYGITETATMVTSNWPKGGRVLGSCGFPVPGLAVRIVDPATRRDVDAGAEGELIVRGPNLMLGYHNKPAETAAALRDGWYHTGDLARADENGFLTITGRLKELIIRGGQNIAPAEIEEVASQFDGVADCAVIGIPHQSLGEVPIIFVAKKDGDDLKADDLLAHCRKHLSAYKVPEAVHFVADIPRTGSGKIMRFKLRDRLSQSNR
ncbi:long-chain-fatty-acid--CoA ligase [Variibacter gotjawalensis]|uniref:3-methylmercaptopropionyl-CoA ligase n=1 Tax=Variibacter gotjawalensis TaxID=1333996 RepID=A0A0S3PZV6_9BRAD|nr:class I adenylate-forming enzyme family protein [Variibacter gotjawalensis]NIK47337.1 acyl-CoA synthetase (AMP-forming)/AMP-acid ligase II [Variibacter gotjawalensis]RZS49235.1 acyl-CoA synthetase (AMP-forming)/AMP-acid ligase II [Variibacter gotjawalensis]BAT61497.1 long-chain-fatty-acid--CoA ligase [Variibacter gotjawalensis]